MSFLDFKNSKILNFLDVNINSSSYSRGKNNFLKVFGGDELIQAQLKLVSLES
jgi:hypothetical protein